MACYPGVMHLSQSCIAVTHIVIKVLTPSSQPRQDVLGILRYILILLSKLEES